MKAYVKKGSKNLDKNIDIEKVSKVGKIEKIDKGQHVDVDKNRNVHH